MTELDQSWISCLKALSHGEVPAAAHVAALTSSARLDVLAGLAYDSVEAKLQNDLIKPFWGQLQSAQAHKGGSSTVQQDGLLQPLQELARGVQQQSQQLGTISQQLLLTLLQQQQQHQHQQQQQQQQQLNVPASTVALLASLCERHRMAVTSCIMATAPFSLPGLLQQYYGPKLHQLCDVIQQLQEEQQQAQHSGDAMSEDGPLSPTEQQQHRSQQPPEPDPLPVLGQQWVQELVGVAAALEQLGLGPASEEAYTRVINSYVLERLRGLATQEFDQGVLPRAQHLVCAGPLAFLRLVLGQTQEGLGAAKLQEWQLRLTYLLLETLGALRSADMFDIVIDYPDSTPALQDLAICLQHTSLAGHFAATFRGALQQRLLHAGAATSDIITTYVSTIRAMQQVDRSGLLLELVSEPIRAYLRSRPDTIRCIVSMLTEGDTTTDAGGAAAGAAGGGSSSGMGGGLLEELQQQQQQQPSQQQLGAFAAAGGAATAAAGGYGLAAAVAAATAGGVGSGAAAAASAAAHASYNWCVGEAEGDEAALRLLEALEAGPAAAAGAGAAGAEAGPGSGVTAAAAATAAAGSGSQGASGGTPTLLGLPLTPPAAAAAELEGSSLSGQGEGDVVSMLIGIYGGPLLFLEEYKSMLAERLLAKEEYDCVREIRTLELLKIRFGESGLHACEVLLKDMADSKRLDANIRALQGAQPLVPEVSAALSRCRATVCSYLFWPELQEHELKLPPQLTTALEVYAERFRHLKAPRKLHWRHTLGIVDLTLSVGDSGPLEFRVTPVHAALLLQFADSAGSSGSNGSNGGGCSGSNADAGGLGSPGSECLSPQQQQQQQGAGGGGVSKSAKQLAAALGVPVPVVRRKAMFWVAAGVLLERRGAKGEVVYTRATHIDPSRIGSREVTDFSWSEAAGAAASAEDRLAAEMGPFENYIMGMLTNFGALPADRLHNMLRVFVVGEPKYEGRSQEQLAAFLQLLAEQGKLDVSNGIYSKHKGPAA